ADYPEPVPLMGGIAFGPGRHSGFAPWWHSRQRTRVAATVRAAPQSSTATATEAVADGDTTSIRMTSISLTIMKRRAILVAALGAAVLLTGCDNIFGLDNYDQPNATLTGRVVYNGEPIGVRSNGVTLQLWQPSYPLEQNVPVY